MQISPIDTSAGRAGRRMAFTLLEILVVIGILSLLAALLFPVFARAREEGRKTGCISNLKQLGMAFAQYVSDYDSHYPDSMSYDTPAGIPSTWDILILPYSKSPAVLQCPSDHTATRFQLPGLGSNLYRSYGYTYNLSKSGHSDTPHDALIPRPTLTVLLGEREPYLSDGAVPHWTYGHYLENLGAQVIWRHNDAANFLFVDGHVRTYTGSRRGAYVQFEGYKFSSDEGSLCDEGAPLPQ